MENYMIHSRMVSHYKKVFSAKAGGKVLPVLEVMEKPLDDLDSLAQQFPDALPSCIVTRAQSRKFGSVLDRADSFMAFPEILKASQPILKSPSPGTGKPAARLVGLKMDTSLPVSQEQLVAAEKADYSLFVSVVDSTVPRSICSSVKYRDQQRKEQCKADVAQYKRLVHSVQSAYQRSNTANTQTSPTKSVKDRTFSELTMRSFSNTSFYSKQAVCPLQQSNRNGRPSSHFKADLSCESPKSQRQPSVQSGIISGNQKSFQDPAQKTYSGDLLQRHSHRFTESKPFSPRMLKSGSKSYLSKYRYYHPPQRMVAQENAAKVTHQDMHHRSTQVKVNALEDERSLLGKCNELEKPEILNWTELRTHCKKKMNMRTFNHFDSSSWEEEIIYLKFVLDVTNDILSRGLYSNRVFDHVFDHHVEMNKHRLSKDKMHQILEVLHGDLERPMNFLISPSEPEDEEKNVPLLDLLHCKETVSKIKKDELCTDVVLEKDSGGLQDVQNSQVSQVAPDLHSENSNLSQCGECSANTKKDIETVQNNEYDYIKYFNVVDDREKQDNMEELHNNFASSLFLS